MIDPRRLRLLVTVADRGSFSAAAEELSYSQSAVSQGIASLEAELGVELFERHPGRRATTLTDAGQALVTRARRILTEVQVAIEEVRGTAARRQLRVVTSSASHARLVASAVRHFRAHHDGVQIEVSAATAEEALDGVRLGRWHLAVVVDRPGLVTEDLDTTTLEHDPQLLVIAAGSEASRHQKLSFDALRDERWIHGDVLTNPEAMVLTAAARGHGFTPQRAIDCDDAAVVEDLVASGVGVALLPGSQLLARDDVVVRQPDPPLFRTTYACVWPTRRTEVVSDMLSCLTAAAETRPSPDERDGIATGQGDHRVQFDFEVDFSNGGGIQGQGFRLDIDGVDIDDEELARHIVRDMRLLMVGEVRILRKTILRERHKRANAADQDVIASDQINRIDLR
jgi:molybdate transport repressor ModE-like protein